MNAWPTTMNAFDPYDVDAVTRLIKEACEDYEPGWSTMASGNAPATYSGGPLMRSRGMSRIDDRADGKFWPFYETELDLIRERNKWRKLAGFTSVAIGAMTALQCYTMGGEWEYEVEPREGCEVPKELVAEANKVLQAILERNNFVGGLDNEIHDASREDGEAPVAAYGTYDGLADIRLLNADSIREPLTTGKLNDWLGVDSREASWSFGVLTRFNERQQRIDHERHVGYHVIFEDSGANWDYLPAWPQCHGDDELDGKFLQFIKMNSPRYAKRGVSDYWPVNIDLEQESKLNINTNVGLAVQAAIAWWEEMPPNANKQQVESQITAALDSFSQRLTNQRGGERSINNMRPGTVPKISAGRKVIAGPMGQQRSPLFLEGRNAIMRRIGLRWLMPEYMITGDASNSNFASTLVAESPFVKAREADQRKFVAHFKELLTKCLKLAFDHGRFDRWVRDWRQFAAMLDLRIQPPMVATRDKAAQMDELFGMFDRGAMDANELRLETRREEKPELEGKTGDPNAQPGMPGALPGAQPGLVAPTRLAAIEGAIRKCKTIEEARAVVRARESEEKWVTINGAAVKIDDNGTVKSGPAGLKGINAKSNDGGSVSEPKKREFKPENRYKDHELKRMSDDELANVRDKTTNEKTKKLAEEEANHRSIKKLSDEHRARELQRREKLTPEQRAHEDIDRRISNPREREAAKAILGRVPQDEFDKMVIKGMLSDRTDSQMKAYGEAVVSWQSHDPSTAAISYAVSEFESQGVKLRQKGNNNSWYGVLPDGRDVRIGDHLGKEAHDVDLIFDADRPLTRERVKQYIQDETE